MKDSPIYKRNTLLLIIFSVIFWLNGCSNGGGGGVASFTVSTSAGANGSISPASVSVNNNETTIFTVTPDTGYLIDSVSGCGGSLAGNSYTTGAVTADCTVTATFIAQTFTVSTSAGANGSISPTSVSLSYNETTSFTLTPDTGFVIDTVSGCGGSLTGNSYTTGAITADCTVTASFVARTLTVSALFPNNGADWNDYVIGRSWSTASDADCTGASDTACLHGGEVRMVDASDKADCTNLTATDALGVFNWVCDDSTGSARFISVGLADGKHLSDLIDFGTPAFLNNAVTVYENGTVWGTSASSAWWNNLFEINNAGGALTTASRIYLVTSNPSVLYDIDADKAALVVQPGVTLTGAGAAAVVFAASQNYIWIEAADINAAGENFGLGFNGNVHFSVVRNTTVNNASGGQGFFFTNTTHCRFSYLSANNNSTGFDVSASSGDNTFLHISSNNNTSSSFNIASANNTIYGITATNNASGGGPSGANNRVASITASNNGNVNVLLGANSTLLGATSANYGSFGLFYSGNNNTASSVVTTNGNSGINPSDSNTFADVATAHNANGVLLFGDSFNTFTGRLLVGNNATDCFVNAGTDPGLDNGTCANNGTSDASLTTGIALTNSFIGKVSADDGQNADDTNGVVAVFPADPTIFDWSHFENPYRGWGKDGSAFPNADHQGRWTTGAGRIWDWSLSSTDTVLRDALSLPTGNDSLTHTWSGTPVSTDNAGCDAMVADSVWNGTDMVCETTFLRRATELMGDGIGNENTLCESGETCLYMPNIGSYQGHGNLISAGTFSDGTISGVRLVKYDTNGR